MRTFDSAHRAAVAHAGGRKVLDWVHYADRLIKQEQIRPVLNRRGNPTGKWMIISDWDWWHVRTEVFEKPRAVAGPFPSKKAAMAAAGVDTSKKDRPGCYRLSGGAEWSLLAVTTVYARGMGVTL